MLEDEKVNDNKFIYLDTDAIKTSGPYITGKDEPPCDISKINAVVPETDDTKTEQDVAKAIDKEARDRKRFFSLLHTIFYICRLAGFKIEGRITMRDLRTGKVWK